MNVVFEKIRNLYNENLVSHAYLIETNDIDKCFLDLIKFLKQINCEKEYNENCDLCNLCNLINQNLLPSLMIIEPDGINIKKEQIIELKRKFSSIPLFTKDNIYIIKNAEKLNASSANTMLKFLEEPSDHILGFFLTSNINNVISTIRSRCEILTINYETSDNEFNEDYYEIAKEYIYKTELEKEEKIMYNNSIILNKFIEKNDVIEIFKIILKIYQNIYFNNYFPGNEFFEFLKEMDRSRLLKRINLQIKILDELAFNVNIELLLDKYVIELSDEDD